MKRLDLSATLVATAIGMGTILVLPGAASAVAATPASAVPGAAPPAGATGADISWPQCQGSSLPATPTGASFGIVGVNDGLAGTQNPCLSAELAWETSLTYNSPKRFYVNTADPGNAVADWPTTNPPSTSNPYGACTSTTSGGSTRGQDSRACAWAYGYDKAAQDVGWVPSPSSAQWWLDIEADNSWQSGADLDRNQSVVDGMLAALPAHHVGIYSTRAQWEQIIGSKLDSHSIALHSLPEWLPTGASSASTSDCSSLPTFTTGGVRYVQYTDTYNFDLACP